MKKYVLLPILASMMAPAMAQVQPPAKVQRHEVSIYGTFGWASLWHTSSGLSSSGESFDKLGGGAGYTFFFHPQWGITTGAEVAIFGTTMHGKKITGSVPETYSYGADTEPMYFNSKLKDYEETQRATYIHIPLLLQFQTAGYHKFYMAVGAKAGFALSGKYEATAASLETSGYLPESAQTFTNMPNHGFTTVRKPSWTGTLDLGLNVALAVEIGARWAMGKHVALYTGLYADYGLLDVLPEKTAGLVNYQPAKPTEFIYRSVLSAKKLSDDTVYVDKMNLFSMGIKVRLAVGW
jgi:hypothetical protein